MLASWQEFGNDHEYIFQRYHMCWRYHTKDTIRYFLLLYSRNRIHVTIYVNGKKENVVKYEIFS